MTFFSKSVGKPFHRIGHVLLLLYFLGTAGCGTSFVQYYFGDDFGGGEDSTERSPVQLTRDGVDAMKEKDYDDAVEAFQQLKERYPYSEYAILAELKLADAYFYKKDYAEAAVAYEEFVRLHPRNEVAPYVLYQMGMCHFLSFRSTDRDLEETQLAMETFRSLLQSFPDSEYAKKAQRQVLECEKRLAAHEFFIGRFYYRQDKYISAKKRLDHVVQAYPQAIEELRYKEQVDEMLAACNRKLSEGNQKESIWTRLGF